MRPTLNDVHAPGPMNSSGSPVSKPWSTSSPPPPAANWPEPERELCARVANRILADGGTDKEAVLGCISAVQSARANKAEGFTPPKAAQENARRVLRWREEYPDEIQGMTQVGWTRARQLASGEAVSLDIVRRMAQFNRHRQNATVDPKYKNEPWRDAGLVAWLGWGGTAGIDWAIRVSRAELSKANYSKQVCMNCKENPPKYRILRNGGQVESWLCEVCFPSWLNNNLGSVTHYNKIGEDGLPKRYKVRRTVKAYLEKQGYTGAMIALFVPPTLAQQLAVKDGLPPDELHVTLAYLGEANQIPDIEKLKAFVHRLSTVYAPLSGTINGSGRFSNINSDGLQPVYASPDLPSLPEMRQRIIQGLESMGVSCSKEHGFIPHITLKYVKPESPFRAQSPEMPVTFDTLSLCLGGVRFDYPLTGVAKEWRVNVVEKQEDRQIVYGVVLRVGQVDSQGDIITDEKEILEAAHNYMIKSRRADWQHEKTLPHEKAIAVESYIAPCDFEINGHQIKKSDWIVGMKIFDPKMWQAIKKGEISAFSIKGLGRRKAVDGT